MILSEILVTMILKYRYLTTARVGGATLLKRYRTYLLTILLSASLSACDGGGDGGGIGGSGLVEPVATGVTLGPISGFGSVIVNGQRFDTSRAEFFVNGAAASQNALRVGMIVRADVDFDTLTAARVDFESTLIGAVEAVDRLNNSFTLLRQSVDIIPVTLLDNLLLSDIAVGDVLEVSGFRDAGGSIIASHVRRLEDVDRVQISGNVTALQTDASTFSIGGLILDYSSADLSALTAQPAEGMPIVASAPANAFDPVSGTLLATNVRPGLLKPVATVAGPRITIELEGVITAVESGERFSVNGQRVTASSATSYVFENGVSTSTSSIALNSRVEVEGVLNSSGNLEASQIIIIPADNSELTGSITDLDPASRSLTLLGVQVATTARTRYDEDDDVSTRGGYDALRIGDYVELQASYIGELLTATRIEIDDFESDATLLGPVTAIDVQGRRLDVLGTTINLTVDTEVEGIDDDQDGASDEDDDDNDSDSDNNDAGGDDDDDVIDESDNAADLDAFLRSLRVGDIVEVEWDNFQSTDVPPDSVELE